LFSSQIPAAPFASNKRQTYLLSFIVICKGSVTGDVACFSADKADLLAFGRLCVLATRLPLNYKDQSP